MPRRRQYRCEDCGQPFSSGYYREPGHRTCPTHSKARFLANLEVQRSPEVRELVRRKYRQLTQEAR